MAEQLAEHTARLHDIESVMDRLKLGRSKVFQVIASGELRSIKVGRRRLVSESALIEFITRLDQQGGPAERADVIDVANNVSTNNPEFRPSTIRRRGP
jgi:excisionase family DNA binding protein